LYDTPTIAQPAEFVKGLISEMHPPISDRGVFKLRAIKIGSAQSAKGRAKKKAL
jgi:hypothetical protein